MKKSFFTVLMLLASTCIFAQTGDDGEYDFDNPKDEIRYGVSQVSRICPTFLWDSWTFKGIGYDKARNCVTMTIQLSKGKMPEKTPSAVEMNETAYWIVKEFMEGYEMIPSENSIFADGDFMLYLSIGTLLRRMPDAEASLEIVLLGCMGTNISPVVPVIKPDKLKALVQ